MYFHSAKMYNRHMHFETGCVYMCECMRDAGAEIDLFVCLHLHERRPGSLPVLCIAE